MATGKIKRWHKDKGFGFIADDAGGSDAFFHISKVQQSDQQYLQEGVAVTFEKLISKKHSGKFDAHNVRLQVDKSDDFFHNPYTFVPSLPRQKLGGFASDFDPLKCDLNHASLQTGLWTGHLPIKLTTITPLVLPKTEGEERSSIKHQVYDTLDHLPESSLRGMLRSAYEVVTNSRYGCFRNDDRLAYRMSPREALTLIPAIIENGKVGELVARLCPGTSNATGQGPKGKQEKGAMYAAMLTLYGSSQQQSQCMNEYTPKTGDEVWAEVVLCQHKRGYLYWKASRVWLKDQQPTKPNPGIVPNGWNPELLCKTPKSESPLVQVVKGRVLITNQNMDNKHDERIFFNPNPSITYDVTNDLKKAWSMRIKSYQEAHSEGDIFKRPGAVDEPWNNIGSTPGETAWSPHLYQDGKHRDRWGRKVHDAIELKPGDMVYARCKFDHSGKGKIEGIEDLFPVMISRELYDASPDDLLDISLKPAASRCESSPADRLFGWVPLRKSKGGYKGRIRVVCEDGVRPEIIQKFDDNLPLAILGQPKPAQGRFYVAKDAEGTPQDDGISKERAGYSKGKGLRGRKQYWHHKGLEANKAKDYWKPSVEDRTQQKKNGRYQEYRRPDKNGNPQTDSQNRSITGWIKPGTVFKASLYVQNLQPEEVGALLWLLSLPKDHHYFKLGYGKPLGFGSVRMEVDEERCVSGCLPLGTGKDWKDYYASFDASPPATLDKDQRSNCIEEFKAGMVAAYNPLPDRNETDEERDDQKTSPQRFDDLRFICGFLQVSSGPQKDALIHYPRRDRKPNPEGKNFEWFVDNERGKKVALPAVTGAKGLPNKP